MVNNTSSTLTPFSRIAICLAVFAGLFLIAQVVNYLGQNSTLAINGNSSTPVDPEKPGTTGPIPGSISPGLNCQNVQCPVGGDNGGSVPPPKCPTTVKQIDLASYITTIEPWSARSLAQINSTRPTDKILSLVAIPENSSADWAKQLNYIEDINDGRGFTISIVGLCTGTGGFLQVVQRVAQLDKTHSLVQFLAAL
jgi:hypothetical protein